MESCKDQILSVQRLLDEAKQYQEAANACEFLALSKKHRLQDAICSGEATTGSPFSDFVFLECGSLNEDMILKLQNLEEQMEQGVARLVLAMHSRHMYCMISDTTGFINEEYHLGVVHAAKFDLRNGKELMFPIHDIVKWDDFRETLCSEDRLVFTSDPRVDGNLQLKDLDVPTGSNTREHNFWPNGLPRKRLEIVVGNDAVQQWFADHDRLSMFEKLKQFSAK